MTMPRVTSPACGVAFVLQCALSAVAAATPEPDARLENVTVRAHHLVVVRQRLQAGSAQLVVPVCGSDDTQTEYLCGLGVTVEVLSDHGWVAATPNLSTDILGGMPISHAKAKVVQAHTSVELTFQFAKKAFVLPHGRPVRLVVDAWPTAEAMRTSEPTIRLVGPSFPVP